jgi:hypothetical protein
MSNFYSVKKIKLLGKYMKVISKRYNSPLGYVSCKVIKSEIEYSLIW